MTAPDPGPDQRNTQRLIFQRLPELNSDSLGWAAIFYASAGIPVHPLLPGSKVPATKNGVKDASTDLWLIRSHWRDNPQHNIGLATGHKFDVLDVDNKGGRPGTDSLARLHLSGLTCGAWAAAITPSGGRHILFTASGDGNHSNAASGLDFRGLVGYIVAAPSNTIEILKSNGEINQYAGTYQWEFSDPDARGQSFDWAAAMEYLHGPAPRTEYRVIAGGGAPEMETVVTKETLAGLLRRVATAVQGERNAVLYWAGKRVAEKNYPAEMWGFLAEAAQDAGLGHREIYSTLRSAGMPGGRTAA